MRSPRLAALLLLAVLFGFGVPLRAVEPAVPSGPVSLAAPAVGLPSTPMTLAVQKVDFCPTFYCPVYLDWGCSCEWIECPSGEIACGRWYGTSATSAVSTPEAFPFPR